ncbi:hypothetical protein BGZ83_006061 [Gryganskiella cystojenkinii]|nr:hypothetical protein BGZ83_006061 [Gryganskiella cystojenkinii]
MSESDLNLPTIVPLLQPKTTNGSAKTKAADAQDAAMLQNQQHLVPSSLKVETALLTKELAKFRACDQNTCFYCREWAQWVFKKTFGKDKTTPTSTLNGSDKKGSSKSSAEPKKKHKEYAMVLCERFYQRSTADMSAGNRSNGATGAGSVAAAALAAGKASSGSGGGGGAALSSSMAGTGHEGFVAEIVDTVRDWIDQPSALYTSPEVFSLVDFESLYAAYSLQTQEQNTAQDDVTPILSTISIEKAHMILGHQGYPLLKRVTKPQLQNQIMVPTCQHTKGHSKTPADLELDKELFNEELKRMRTRDQEGLKKQIGPVWRHVEEALERMDGAERVRSGILGPTRSKEFAQTYKDKLVSFQEIWSEVEATAKKTSSKKKGSDSEAAVDPVDIVDLGWKRFIDNLQFIHRQLTEDVLESSERSLREFIKELAMAQTKILKLALTRIQEGKVGTARIDKILEESPEKCRNALKMVEQLIPIFDTKMGQFRVLVLNKLKEVDEEVESVATAYYQESQKTVQGRLEKAANKDFRRRIKKLEFISVEIRKWFFQSRLTLFSSLDFATVCLNTLGILMEEAEVLEAVQLGLHDDHFRSRVMKSQEGRMKLAHQFREGIKTGRRVLAVMISRLMMREGARAMGEMAAIQKEKKFLKSIGQDVSDSKFSTKGFLVPSRDVTPTASAQVSDDEDAGTSATVSKNKKKKDKKKKKAAEAAAAAATAATATAGDEEIEGEDEPEPEQEEQTNAEESATPGSGLRFVEPVETHQPVLSGKEARELKKQAKKDAKRQAKEQADAEEAAAKQRAQGVRELKETYEWILRKQDEQMQGVTDPVRVQQAEELKKRAEAELHRLSVIEIGQAVEDDARRKAQEARAIQVAQEAKALLALMEAKERKAAEEAEARRQAQEAREVKEAEARRQAQVARQAKEAKEAETRRQAQLAQEAKEADTRRKAQEAKEAKEAEARRKAQEASEVKEAITRQAKQERAPAVKDTESTSSTATAETKVPTWGPSAATLANRAAQAAREAERAAAQVAKKNEKPESKISNRNSMGASRKEHVQVEAAAVVEPESQVQPAPQAAAIEAEHDEQVPDSLEDLARLPSQTLVSLVHTLQVENKSLLTTLVSMQQQVSSLTERYSTLASLAREHEQQAIQAMELQKQREMEEVKRYVWKVEERCRQLEKHVLATHQHRMQMQQLQQQQQQQQFQQGPPGFSSMGNVSMPPPGFNSNLLGLGRQPSAPSSPSLAHRTLNGVDSTLSMSTGGTMPSSSSSSSTGFADMMASTASGLSVDSILSPQVSSSLSATSESGSPITGYSEAKKTHWRQRGEVRCGNCAQLGHSSAECQAGCRYCGQPGHLSQDCPRIAGMSQV